MKQTNTTLLRFILLIHLTTYIFVGFKYKDAESLFMSYLVVFNAILNFYTYYLIRKTESSKKSLIDECDFVKSQWD